MNVGGLNNSAAHEISMVYSTRCYAELIGLVRQLDPRYHVSIRSTTHRSVPTGCYRWDDPVWRAIAPSRC